MGITKAKVISDRGVKIPDKEGMGMRQAVVRIRSKQSLKKQPPPPSNTPNNTGKLAQSTTQDQKQKQDEEQEKVQESTEYIVIQRLMFDHEEGDWKVWGLASETTPEVVETDPAFAPGLSVRDRMAMRSSPG